MPDRHLIRRRNQKVIGAVRTSSLLVTSFYWTLFIGHFPSDRLIAFERKLIQLLFGQLGCSFLLLHFSPNHFVLQPALLFCPIDRSPLTLCSSSTEHRSAFTSSNRFLSLLGWSRAPYKIEIVRWRSESKTLKKFFKSIYFEEGDHYKRVSLFLKSERFAGVCPEVFQKRVSIQFEEKATLRHTLRHFTTL